MENAEDFFEGSFQRPLSSSYLLTFDEEEEDYVFLSQTFCLVCSETFIKGPNISTHRELWLLILKIMETKE